MQSAFMYNLGSTVLSLLHAHLSNVTGHIFTFPLATYLSDYVAAF